MHAPPLAPGTPNQGLDDEIIPTAIVIKNIPFNVKRETLLDIIVCIFFTAEPHTARVLISKKKGIVGNSDPVRIQLPS